MFGTGGSFPRHKGHHLQPSICSVLVVRSPDIKQLGHEVDHSLPSNAKFKNEWSCIITPPVCLYGKYRDSFTFTFMNVI